VYGNVHYKPYGFFFCSVGSCSRTLICVEKIRVVPIVNMEKLQHAYRNISHNMC